MGTTLRLSTAYHPQTDGSSKRTNQTAEIALRHYIASSDIPWTDVIPALQFSLNNALSKPIKVSSNKLVLGFKPKDVLTVLSPTAPMDKDALQTARELHAAKAKHAVDFANVYAKDRYDRQHRQVAFEPG